MPREKPLAVGTVLQGKHRYRVKRLVGGGGMAWVYQVERLDGDANLSLWALKELRPQTEDPETQAHARTLFNQEAQILSQLSHPNLPEVIDFFEDQGRAYLVMEFIWGESLEKRLEQTRSPLLEREVLQWAVQVCDVLEYLHTRQPPVIFRDMKPSNIMVDHAGLIKLVDFGIARTYKEDKLKDTIALGSENYAAPEQWGQAQTDARSDIYGLGATMYHLLANMPPSPAFLPSDPQPLNELNGALSPQTVQIVSRAMARDRADRYQSATEMGAAILACLPGYVSPIRSAHLDSVSQPTVQSPQSVVREPVSVPSSTSVSPHQPTSGARAARTQIRRPSDAVQRSAPKPAVRRVVRRVKLCPRCRHRNDLSARFCVQCGYAFAGLRPGVLRVIEPVRAAWEMPIRKGRLLLGRASPQEGYKPDFDMSFYDPEGYVSRRHAEIIRARNGYFVVDLDSSNGTFVNDRSLSPGRPRLLHNGDQIAIGEVVIQFLLR
jgi:serine/threonine protein kinase